MRRPTYDTTRVPENSGDIAVPSCHLHVPRFLRAIDTECAYLLKKSTIGLCTEIDTEPPGYYAGRWIGGVGGPSHSIIKW